MRSFPRTRGDGPQRGHGSGLGPEFPPHSRGWTVGRHRARRSQMVSPALAGMDPPTPLSRPESQSFPRTRGDGPQ